MPHTLKPVKSSQIEAISHCPETNTLRIQFKPGKGKDKGDVYEYADFTAEQYAALEKAESTGKHFYATIKGKHAYKKKL